MSQFTVYRNNNARTGATFPLLIDVQSNLLADLRTRVVIPLSQATVLTKKPLDRLTPMLEFDGEGYVLMTPQVAGIERSELGAAIGSLVDSREAILAALDFLVTGF